MTVRRPSSTIARVVLVVLLGIALIPFTHAPASLAIGRSQASGTAALPASATSSSEPPSVMAPGDYVEGELLVLFEPGASVALRSAVNGLQGSVKARSFRLLPSLELVRLKPGRSVAEAARAYEAMPGVVYAEPNAILHASVLPNDPRFAQLWGLKSTITGSDADIDAPEAWDVTTGSKDVVVAVIDSGIAYTHEDLAANMWVNPGEVPGNGIDDDGNGYVDDVHGWNTIANNGNPMDDNDHGTHCAGTIGGVGNNGIGVTGVDWNVSLMAVKFLDSTGNGTSVDLIEAVEYADAAGARVANCSFGTYDYVTPIYDAFAATDMLFVCSAGNDSLNMTTIGVNYNYPACFNLPQVISVGASDLYDTMAYYSNYSSTTVDVFAPGSVILSTVPAGYGLMSGTSMASPHVAGIAALLLARKPGLSAVQLKSAIMGSVDVKSALTGLCVTGGRVNARGALDSISSAPVAGADAGACDEDVYATVGVLGNDTDADGDPLTAELATGPAHGVLELAASGAATYTPDANWSGTDAFTYRAFDGDLYSQPATVTITVTPVNDAPSFTKGGDVTVDENSGAYSAGWASGVTPGPLEAEEVAFEVSAENDTLFSAEPTVSPEGVLSFTPRKDTHGSALVSVTLRDAGGLTSATETFTIEVTALEATFVSIEGADRYATAVEASKKAYPTGLDPAGAKTVVIATGANWPDALGGASLAGALDGPILLTPTNSIPSSVMAEIDRLDAEKAVIVGGPPAVSVVVEDALKAKLGSSNVERLSGDNRYATANAVAARVITLAGAGFTGDAFIATGANFPDSLAASPIAAAGLRPLYLVAPTATSAPALPGAVVRVAILGSTGAVNANVESSLKTKLGDANVVRLGGASRYDTAVLIATYGVEETGLSWDGVAIATGTNFPDALGGGVLQGKTGSVMLLTDPKTLSTPTRTALTAHAAGIYEVRYFGSVSAVSQVVRDAVEAILE
jgi:subtilisin family serine protease/putative cell wall-binding protein